MALIKRALARAFSRTERVFEYAFGQRNNPFVSLGALGWYFYWIVAVTGASGAIYAERLLKALLENGRTVDLDDVPDRHLRLATAVAHDRVHDTLTFLPADAGAFSSFASPPRTCAECRRSRTALGSRPTHHGTERPG